MQHSLLKIQEQPANFIQYKWYVECTCGFQCRTGTEEAAKSQFDNHLVGKGEPAFFANKKSDKQEVQWPPAPSKPQGTT